MSQIKFEEPNNKAVEISALIEEIIQLDELLALHEQHNANSYEKQQYIERQQEFIEALNELLNPHHLKLVTEGQVV